MAIPIPSRQNFSNWAARFWDNIGSLSVAFLIVLTLASIPWLFFALGSAAVLCAGASTAAGSFAGFLFGIPRTQQRDGRTPVPASTPVAPATPGSAPSNSSALPNTNLEEVSDWLTKIVVGVGLVEWQSLGVAFSGLSENIAIGFSKTGGTPIETCRIIAGSLLISYAIVGFFFGYLVTRFFLGPAFVQADRKLDDLAVKHITDAPVVLGEFRLTGPAHAAAEQIRQIPLDSLSTWQEAWAWARAQLAANSPQDAVKGYEKAIRLAQQQGEDNSRLHLGYAAALQTASGAGKKPILKARQELETALRLLGTNPDPTVKRRVYITLTYYFRYDDPPNGFQTCLKYGQEYVKDTRSAPSADIFANLAAAYGQAFRWAKENPTQLPEHFQLGDYREAALWAVKEAVQTDAEIVPTLRKLLLPASEFPGKDPQDNDLEVFSTDEPFREALMLLPPPPLPPAPGLKHDADQSK